MKNIILTTILSLLFSCSNKPELNLIIDDILGYKIGNNYQIISHNRSPKFLNYFGKYNSSYTIQLNKEGYLGLIGETKKTWKLQSSSKHTYKQWERITRIKAYDLMSVSTFNTTSKIINVHLSD